jgi:hypothetical protein
MLSVGLLGRGFPNASERSSVVARLNEERLKAERKRKKHNDEKEDMN